MNNKGSIFGTTAFWIILCLIVVFFFGLFVGRSTCTRPSSVPGTTTVTPETPSPQFGSGILTPVPQPPSLFPGKPQSLRWYQFSDAHLEISVHADSADSIKYTFRKRWFVFRSVSSVESLSVFGVAPESVRVSVSQLPAAGRKNFSLILSMTTEPSAHILFGYKSWILHGQYLQAGDLPNSSSKFHFGIGYHIRF